jgi:hypothetical protein
MVWGTLVLIDFGNNSTSVLMRQDKTVTLLDTQLN